MNKSILNLLRRTLRSASLALLICGAPLFAGPGDLLIEPEGGPLENGREILLSFPVPMVTAERIEQADPAPPVIFGPEPLPFQFVWRSPTEARLTVLGPVVPGLSYAIRLAPGARSLDGAPLVAKLPEHEFSVPAFDVACHQSSDSELDLSPMVSLTFTHPVDIRNVADKIFFLDSSTRRRFPVNILVGVEEATDEYYWADPAIHNPTLPPGVAESEKPFLLKRFSVQPRSPLPPGRKWKVLVEGVTEAATGKPLSFPRLFAVGSTNPLEVEWLGAFNFAGQKPHIAARFNRRIDPATINASSVKVEPQVPNLKILPNPPRDLVIEGDFDTSKKYKVTLSKSIKAASGFNLIADSVWGATFKPRQSSIIFPDAEIAQRSALGLNFAFIQSNTKAGQWRLARVPHEKLPALRAKLREFQQDAIDPATGRRLRGANGETFLSKPTELLIEYFSLEEVASGSFDASPDGGEVLREIFWRPEAARLPYGPHLLEVTAPGPDGRLRGNRSLVWFSDFAITQKRSATELILRVSSMADGSPVAGADVSAITDDGAALASAKTGKDGIAKFRLQEVFPPRSRAAGASRFLVKSGGATTSIPAYTKSFRSGYSYSGAEPPALVGFATTDRPIYRPGEPLRVKGIIRNLAPGSPGFAKGASATVRIFSGENPVAEFDAPLTPLGGWEVEWNVPAQAALGYYQIEASVGGQPVSLYSSFQVEEIRKPLFSVEVARADSEPGKDSITIRSEYFHGSPNAGAVVRWTAEWFTNSDWDWEIKFSDLFSEGAVRPVLSGTASGETRLDQNGAATISIPPPFTDKALRARCYVNWKIDVTSPEGQTLTAGCAHSRQLVPAAAGISAIESIKDERGLKISLFAVDESDKKLEGLPMKVEVFRIDTKSFKQQISPMVFRYVNTETFARIHSREAKSGESFILPVKEPGRYITVARMADDPKAPQVSDRTTITGSDYTGFPVESEDELKLEIERDRLKPGEMAVLKTNGPRGGVAWVTVEGREVLESKIVSIEGNAGRIELPVKPEYAPNATIAVHLISPGGADELPTERFGFVSITVDRPDLTLELLPKLNKPEYQPGENVSGRVIVTSEGKPVAGAEVTVWAVDESILKLGSWSLPNILSYFLPTQPYSVTTYSALGELVRSIARDRINQKGFVIGDGGDPGLGNVLMIRENFKPLAFWSGNLISGPDGTVTFAFKAPDNLTTWRVISIAHSDKNQFGAASSTFVVNKKLMVEPAFPRFVRSGDLFELRGVVRQRHDKSASVRVTASVSEGPVELLGAEPKTVEVARDTAAVVRFPARAIHETGTAKIRFVAESPGFTDGFEVVLPVATPEVTEKETVAIVVPANTKFDAAASMPEEWKGKSGRFTAAVSSSLYFAKLSGLPALLEYPHGCMEQITSRLLGYSMLGKLIDFLPDSQNRREQLEATIGLSLKKIEEALLEDGSLPYWPGGTERNPFVTAQAGWMIEQLKLASLPVPEKLAETIPHAVAEIALGRIGADPETQALALFATALANPASEEARASADSLYLRRERFSHEARGLLALALTKFGHNTPARDQLLNEIGSEIPATSFNPKNFSSLTRAEAIRIVAKFEAGGKNWSKQNASDAKKRLLGLMESGTELSTQENLWTLAALLSLIEEERPAVLPPELFKPVPQMISDNNATVAWAPTDAEGLSKITGRAVKQPLSWVFTGEFMLPPEAQQRSDRGIRIERIARNLTAPERTGEVTHPFRIGDEVLITYRLVTDRTLHYVALEDPLPSIFETINPNIASIAEFYKLPDSSDPQLLLSHSELRDNTTLLYFDRIDKGTGTFAILARVTAAGRSFWPGASATPMYDARWSGRGVRTLIYSVAE